MPKLDIDDLDFDPEVLAQYQVPRENEQTEKPEQKKVEVTLEEDVATDEPAQATAEPTEQTAPVLAEQVIQDQAPAEEGTTRGAQETAEPVTEALPPQDQPVQTDSLEEVYEAQTQQVDNQAYHSPKKSSLFTGLVTGVVILAVSGAGFFGYNHYSSLKSENAKLSDPQTTAIAEAKDLESKVARLIELEAEAPSIKSVVDVAKIKNQSFFANAMNGDKLLVYSKNNKVILYRPSTDKIVEVAPIGRVEEGGSTAGATTTNPNN